MTGRAENKPKDVPKDEQYPDEAWQGFGNTLPPKQQKPQKPPDRGFNLWERFFGNPRADKGEAKRPTERWWDMGRDLAQEGVLELLENRLAGLLPNLLAKKVRQGRPSEPRLSEWRAGYQTTEKMGDFKKNKADQGIYVQPWVPTDEKGGIGNGPEPRTYPTPTLQRWSPFTPGPDKVRS